MTPESTTEVLCGSLRLSKDDALDRVHGGVRSLWPRRCVDATLWYKPLWDVRAGLVRGGFRRGSGHGTLVAVVDGLTGIARCLRPGSPATVVTAQPVAGKHLVAPTVDAARAGEAAERVIRRAARRRRVPVGELDEPTLFYKPVWLVSQTTGGRVRYAVDAHSGVLARVPG